jgi:hypothetical protein
MGGFLAASSIAYNGQVEFRLEWGNPQGQRKVRPWQPVALPKPIRGSMLFRLSRVEIQESSQEENSCTSAVFVMRRIARQRSSVGGVVSSVQKRSHCRWWHPRKKQKRFRLKCRLG